MPVRRLTLLGPLLAMALLAGCSATAPQTQPPQGSGQKATAAPPLTAVSLRSESVGWALGGGKLYRTGDGGATWTDVTPAGAQILAGQPDAGPVAFVQTDLAWAFGQAGGTAQLFHTADGGKTWSKAQVPAVGHLQPFFLDAQNGWLLAHQDVSMHHERVSLLRTTNGGTSWTQVAAVDPGKPQQDGDLPAGGIKTGVTFTDAQTGFLTGDEPAPRVYLYATHDGGKTWNPVAAPVPPGMGQEGLITQTPRFFGTRDGILPVIGSQHIAFLVTHDGGATWTAGGILPRTPSPTTAWSFSDAQHGWAAPDGKLHATADGGKTWQDVKSNLALTGVFQLDFASARAGLLLQGAGGQTQDGRLLRTADGGATWN